MSAPGIERIFVEASARLETASYGDETRQIGINFYEASGVSLIETLFARVTAEAFSDEQINTTIIATLEELLSGISASFEACGVRDVAYLGQCLEAAERGFLARGEALFEAPMTAGRA